MIKKIIQNGFKKIGYRIQKIDQSKLDLTMAGGLQRCLDRGLNVNTIIDVGASNSSWSRMCMEYYPNAKYLMIEAQDAHKNDLEKLKTENNNVDYVLAAAGNREGTIYFDNESLFGGLASETPFEKNCIEVPVTSIDKEIKKRNLKPPFLIKLDTHGFEVPILEGAQDALKQAELVIIETYNFQLNNDSLKYYQMCKYMEDLGFSSIEMVDSMLRLFDKSFWQMDTFFIPSNSKEFNYRGYQ
jgi:FkbM family methyltransferase